MTTSTVLLAAIEYTVVSHIAIFAMAIAIAILPVALVSHLAAKSNKERRRRYEAQVQADERFHTLLRALNRREAETRAQKIEFVMKQQPPPKKAPTDNASRRRFLPLNPQQGCVS